MLKTDPNATVTARSLALVSVIGSDLSEMSVLLRGLQALEGAGIAVHGAQQGLRRIEVQFLVPRDALEDSIKTLHAAFVQDEKQSPKLVA